ncbi:cation:proton antiporter [Bhargavaea cecembensis]|uniref:Cation:proton antiporter n=1 Tax=Bhargavaea cecembensis TaxID=394098 RepID=A0A163ERE4_9BACL|nr:Na+/H+ antiporter subunit E [Bhargavaea cecembensis]KZE37016.1 cation:proton antiporter [Bhargavaea cecembensis]
MNKFAGDEGFGATAAQFLLNLFIAFLWMLLLDEDQFRATTFIAGFIVGIFIVFFMHRFFGTQFYLRKLFAIIKLVLIFNRELVKSSISVIAQILSPTLKIRPGIFRYDTVLESDAEVTMLSLLLTLTPGSVVMEITEDGQGMYIHAMDLDSSKEALLAQLNNFEQAIMEVTR